MIKCAPNSSINLPITSLHSPNSIEGSSNSGTLKVVIVFSPQPGDLFQILQRLLHLFGEGEYNVLDRDAEKLDEFRRGKVIHQSLLRELVDLASRHHRSLQSSRLHKGRPYAGIVL